jgi:hypothetical protein
LEHEATDLLDRPAPDLEADNGNLPTNRSLTVVQFHEILDNLKLSGEKWKKSGDVQSLRAVKLLAYIYQSVPHINNGNRPRLILEVKAHPDVIESKRWLPEDKSTEGHDFLGFYYLNL